MRKMVLYGFDFNDYTDIQYAALSGQAEYLRRMLENGEDLDSLEDLGYTLLQFACKMHADEEIIDTILDFKPDMNIISIEYNTALMIFIEDFPPNERLLKRFLEQGADPNISGFQGRTSLHLACSYSQGVHYEEYIRLLLQFKADVHFKDKEGYTPLHLAIFKGVEWAVTILLQNGADIYNENLAGQTALDMAIFGQPLYPQVLKKIVEHFIIQQVGKQYVIPEDVKVFCENEEFNSFKDRCHSELEKIKNITVGDSIVTYYDIYYLPPNALAKTVSHPNIVQSFYEFDRKIFPIFGEYMFPNFQAGLQRLKAIEIGHIFWGRIYPDIPEHLIDNMNYFLTNEDLENLERTLQML